MAVTRRQFIFGALAAGAGAGTVFSRRYVAEGLLNPCLGQLPPALVNNEWMQAAWAGVRADQAWDCHAHVAGVGSGGSGIAIHPDMDDPFSPWRYVQKAAYMNAACAKDNGEIDASYVGRLNRLLEGMVPGYKAMLLAFDWFHDTRGNTVPARSTFYVPNEYVQKIVATNPSRLEWLASVHPYRGDAIPALEAAASYGARGVKWLPAAQGMDPSSPRCHAFYDAMARLKLPLLIHCGEEQAVHGGDTQHYGNPLHLRVPLERGVKVIVAHCASMGSDQDTDKGENGPRVSSFELFARLMDEPQYRGRLYGDISAITQVNREPHILPALLQNEEWHDRLLHGSDYPLPGVMPLYSTQSMIAQGLLPEAAREPLVEIRRHNPLLYDFVLKRHLRWQGKGFAAGVFETRRHF